MLLDGILFGGDGEVLRRSFGAVDPIGEANAREAEGIVAVEAMGGDLDGEFIGVLVELGGHLKIFGMAEAMGVFIAESSDLAAEEVLGLYGEEDKVMAKAGDDAFSLKVAGVDEELNAVAAAEIAFAYFFEGAMDDDVKAELLKVPGRIDVGKDLFTEQIGGGREQMALFWLEGSSQKEAIGS